MSSRARWRAAAASLVAVGIVLLWRAADEPAPVALAPVAEAPEAAPTTPHAEPLEPAPAPAPVAAAPVPRPAEPEAEDTVERIPSSPWLEARMRDVMRAEQAQVRWDEGIEREELEARHVEPAVRRFFDELELEPVLLDGGLMEGLEIRRVVSGGFAQAAGLAPGDRIVSLRGQALSDPRDLPDLLVRLPRRLPLCVERDGGRRCLELELD